MNPRDWLTQNQDRLLEKKILTERQLEIFRLREIEGLQFRLIGMRFGCDREQVRRAYYRARRVLAQGRFNLSASSR